MPADSCQLPLEALVARYSGLITGSDIALEYWKLSGNPEKASIKPVTSVKIAEAESALMALIAQFDKEATSYAASSEQARYNDYEHLTRRQEWESA